MEKSHESNGIMLKISIVTLSYQSIRLNLHQKITFNALSRNVSKSVCIDLSINISDSHSIGHTVVHSCVILYKKLFLQIIKFLQSSEDSRKC